MLPADGNFGGPCATRFRRSAARGALLHFLFRDDVDGNAAGCIGGVYRVCHRQLPDNADSLRRLPIRARRICFALCVCLASRVAVAQCGWRQSRVVDSYREPLSYAYRHRYFRGGYRGIRLQNTDILGTRYPIHCCRAPLFCAY